MENQETDIIFYSSPAGQVKVEVIFNDETFWLNQRRMAELFGVDVRTINEHLQNIYVSEELHRDSTIRKIRIVQKEGNRDVARDVDFYNLDAIIAVGYRVNSFQATQFRIWATQTLREFIIKGFVLDDERLKQGKRFGKDYFDELLDRIREIRAREGFTSRLPTSMSNAALTISRILKSPRSFLKPFRTNFTLLFQEKLRQRSLSNEPMPPNPIWGFKLLKMLQMEKF